MPNVLNPLGYGTPSQAGKCCHTVTDATSSETHGKPRVTAGEGRDR